MSITYFPCLSIYHKKQLVYSFSAIDSLSCLFEVHVVEYLQSIENHFSANSDMDLAVLSIKEINHFQIYHIYAYRINENDIVFLMVSIVLAETPLRNIMDNIYEKYVEYCSSPSIQRNRVFASDSKSLNQHILELLIKYEKDMSFYVCLLE